MSYSSCLNNSTTGQQINASLDFCDNLHFLITPTQSSIGEQTVKTGKIDIYSQLDPLIERLGLANKLFQKFFLVETNVLLHFKYLSKW